MSTPCQDIPEYDPDDCPLSDDELKLQDLLLAITQDNLHHRNHFGYPVGKEKI